MLEAVPPPGAECAICIEPYKGKKVVKVTCQYCPSHACRGCQQRYLLQSYEDPHCMECKRGWSSDFLAANFPLVFRNDTLRKHRRKVLFEREKTVLPAIQVYVGYKREIERLDKESLAHRAVFGSMYGADKDREGTVTKEYLAARDLVSHLATRVQHVKHEVHSLKQEIAGGVNRATNPEWNPRTELAAARARRKTLKQQLAAAEAALVPRKSLFLEMEKQMNTINYERYRNQALYDDRWNGAGAAPAPERKEFIMKCPDEGCRGFLSSAYKCGTCAKWTCAACLVVLGAEKECGHTCDKDAVETAKTIKAETRPCPKCGTRIFKIDGCFAKDTPILLWNGQIRMSQDIRVGDELIGDDGQKRVVEEICTGIDEMYEVLQRDGMPYTVNSKHKLCLKFSSEKVIHYSNTEKKYVVRWFDRDTFAIRTKKGSEEEIKAFVETLVFDEVIEITVEDYVNLSDGAKQHLMGFKSDEIYWPHQNVKLDPYVLGLWLGDGINNGTSFAITPETDPEILKYILDWCKQNDAELVHDAAYKFRIRQRKVAHGRLAIGRGTTSAECKGCKEKKCSLCDLPSEPYTAPVEGGKCNPMKAALEYYDELKDKHIPLQYLVNDRETRLQLLAGLIDTDGCVSSDGKRIQIPQVRHGLARQIGFLARSLGFIVHLDIVKKKNVPFPGKIRKDYADQLRVSISGKALSKIPCRVARKKCMNSEPNKDWLRTRIEVLPLGQDTYYGWKVTQNKRFLLADTTVLRNCDQMFCVMEGCHTAFSWNTGHIVTGVIHNPHYYEWLRRTGGGQAPREAGDIPCGGLPTAWAFTNVLQYTELNFDERNRLLESHRYLRELIDWRLREYPARAPASLNKEVDVQYLMNKIDEAEWQRQLEFNEAKFRRKREIGQVLQMAATAASDILNRMLQQGQALGTGHTDQFTDWIRTRGFPELDALLEFVNQSFRDLAKREHMAVPQFGSKWELKPIRALYRKKPAAKKGAAAAAGAAAAGVGLIGSVAEGDDVVELLEDDDVANEIVEVKH